METPKVEVKDFTGLIHFDEEHKLYSIVLLEEGGPIINGESLEEAKKSFEEGMSVTLAVRNLSAFAKGENWWKLGKINYVEMKPISSKAV